MKRLLLLLSLLLLLPVVADAQLEPLPPLPDEDAQLLVPAEEVPDAPQYCNERPSSGPFPRVIHPDGITDCYYSYRTVFKPGLACGESVSFTSTPAPCKNPTYNDINGSSHQCTDSTDSVQYHRLYVNPTVTAELDRWAFYKVYVVPDGSGSVQEYSSTWEDCRNSTSPY